MVREDNNEERKEALLPTDTDENTQGNKARTIGGVYQDLKQISEQKGVDLGFGDETEESFIRKYGTGRGDELLYNKLKEVSKEKELDLGLPDDVLEWKASLIRGDEQGTSKPSLDGVERPAAAGTEVQERKVGTQAVEKSPYEELFRRADERREQRRREAEALKPQESAQEIEARHERLRKAAAISDAVAAIGNVLWAGRGSRQVYDPRQSMSEAAKKRYAERMARYDKQQQAWLRAREAYERGENTIENLRMRAMEYEDRRKAREADAERRAAESKKRQEDIDNRIKNRDSRTQQQNRESEGRISKTKSDAANNRQMTNSRIARNSHLNDATDAGRKRQDELAAKKKEVLEAQKNKYNAEAGSGGNNVRAERYTKAAQGVVAAGQKLAGGGKTKKGGVKRQTKTRL